MPWGPMLKAVGGGAVESIVCLLHPEKYDKQKKGHHHIFTLVYSLETL